MARPHNDELDRGRVVNDLRDLVDRYLQVRRTMGFRLEEDERILGLFLRFLDEQHSPEQNLVNTLEWAGTGSSSSVVSIRISVVRRFVRWGQPFDPRLEPIPQRLLPMKTHRATPYIYPPEQTSAPMDRAARLPQLHRAATYWTLLGLLSCTGMRVGEALRLDRSNVHDGLIHINDSKFGVSRVVPVDPSTVQALGNYTRLRDAKFPHPGTEAFFVSLRGTRLIYSNVHITVQGLLKAAGIDAISKQCRPRIHDFRHTFATATLRDAHVAGRDPGQLLPILATYLGHRSVQGTFWYLEADPALLDAAAQQVPLLQTPTGEQS